MKRLLSIAAPLLCVVIACASSSGVRPARSSASMVIPNSDSYATSDRIKTTADDAGVLTPHVIIDDIPDGGIQIGAIAGPAANGANRSGNPVAIAGSDGTKTRDLKTDTSGDLSVVRAYAENATLLATQPSNASVDSAAVDERGKAAAWFAIQLAAASTPVASIQIVGGSTSTVANMQALPLADVDVIGLATGVTHSTGAATIAVANTIAADASLLVRLPNPPPYLAFRYTRASDGTTGNRLNVQTYAY
jgi:hypothetical protein